MEGQVRDITEAGIGLYVPVHLAPGSVVRLKLNGSVVHGFVSHAAPRGSQFRVGVEVIQVLIGESDLSQLLTATFAELARDVHTLEAPQPK